MCYNVISLLRNYVITATLLTNGKTIQRIYLSYQYHSQKIVFAMYYLIQNTLVNLDSVIPGYNLNAMSKCLEDIMGSDAAFGGKIILQRSSFGQTFPIVAQAPLCNYH